MKKGEYTATESLLTPPPGSTIKEYGCYVWGRDVPPAGSKYDWSSSPFWGVVPDSETVYIDTAVGDGVNWVKPDSYTINYDSGTITVTHSADFDQITIKFEVKQPSIHVD